MPTTKNPPAVTPDSALASIGNAPAVQPTPVTPAQTAPLAAGNPTATVSQLESPRRNSLTVPDTILNPLSPADARPTVDTSRTEAPTEKIPDAVNLSCLDSPPAELSAPNQPTVIRLPTFDDHAPVRPEPPSLNVFFSPALSDTAVSSPANPRTIQIFSTTGTTSVQTVSSNQISALPLPAVSPVSWPTNIRSAAPALDLSSLITSPAPAPQPAPVATHEARDNLHQKVYSFILGN